MGESESVKSTGPAAQPNRVKGSYEDTRLKTFIDDPDMDRSLLDSRRRAILNPDLLKPLVLRCYCGDEINIRNTWYVMVNDGTLVCNNCARCNCCSRESQPISRRLVCIDGLVLCYQCIRFYGHLHRPKLKMRVVPLLMKSPLSAQKPAAVANRAAAEEPSSTSNASDRDSDCEYYYDYDTVRVDRSRFMPKVDSRRLSRQKGYEPPVRELPWEDDPRAVPPEYLAENSRQQPMTCPACNSVALGPGSYVVPSMARVYHRRCFRCCNCKESLTHGFKIAGFTFEYCSCPVPLVWCTKAPCRHARFMHHNMEKCHLGCIRPGGRYQMDYTAELKAERSDRKKRPDPR